MSDLTRDAMRIVLTGVDRDAVISLRLEEFRSALGNIERKIDRLAAEFPREPSRKRTIPGTNSTGEPWCSVQEAKVKNAKVDLKRR